MSNFQILETQRLFLREMDQSDYQALSKILQDQEVMYAYNGAFSDEETQNWLNKQLNRYKEYGFGLWAVVLKESNEMIGQCGLTMQEINEVDEIDSKQKTLVMEIGYLFQKKFWHQGYAIEAAKACKNYAFRTLNANEVFSIIRESNVASQNVAIRNGMKIVQRFTKHYRGIEMTHLVFSVKNTIS